MHYRRLGHTGLKISEISLGTWVTFGNQLDSVRADEMVHAAYENGINHFDCADVYTSGEAERLLGAAIADLPRTALILATKAFGPSLPGPNGRGLSRKHLTEALHASLTRMNVDYLDIFYCHRFDPDTPIEEIVRAMETFIQQGKILYWGTSEWDAAQISQAYGVARQLSMTPPAVEQPQYNMFHRKRVEVELAPLVKEFSLGLLTWSPLYYGVLSGKYNESTPPGSRATLKEMGWMQEHLAPEKIAKVKQLTALANELELTTSQLALAWTLRRREISSIISGASTPEQLDENLLAAEEGAKLTEDVLDMIESIMDNQPE